MPQITQSGALNTTALTVPDLYVNIVPPTPQNLNGVPTNILGIVGTASWGPVNSPVIAGVPAQGQAVFGPPMNRANDLMTACLIANQQGAANFRLVRVTDGTDVAATIVVQTSCITFTAKYSGTFGNGIVVSVGPGTQASTIKVTVAAPGLVPEVFDNIGSGLSGNALWLAIAAAVNNGVSIFRGASQIVIASAGAGTTAPATASYTLAAGTDGVASITASVMLGADTGTRSGMYALRGTGVSVAMLADMSTTSSWATQAAFGLSEGVYMIGTTASGDTISNATTTLSGAGVDSYAFKLMLGDWVYWLDTYNNATRLISPQAFIAGLLANLSPQNSSLNKPLQGIVGTQKTASQLQYSVADIQALVAARIDVIANPSVGGPYFSARIGHNTSSNANIWGDNYTRATNYIASTLDAGMGIFVGQVENPTLLQDVTGTLNGFAQSLWDAGVLGNTAGTVPFSIECDAIDNPQQRAALGFLQADTVWQIPGIAEKFLLNAQVGSSVTIQRPQNQ